MEESSYFGSSGSWVGAVYHREVGDAELFNCTFVGNEATGNVSTEDLRMWQGR